MKNIKKVLLTLVLFIGVFVLTGCSVNKKPITADEFKVKMEGKGYILYDATSQFNNSEKVKNVYVAREKDGKYQIEFFELTNESYAIDAYNVNKSKFESSLGSIVSGKVDIELKGVQKYRATSNGYYMSVTRKGNTMIYVKVPSEYTKVVSNVINELGY